MAGMSLTLYRNYSESDATYLTTDEELTSVANAIRTKAELDWRLVYPTGFVSAINAIQTGERGIKYAKFDMTASDTFTFVEGYPLTYSELMDDCFFCGAALGTNYGPAYISGINGYGSLMFAFDHEQFCLPISILNYNNGIITIDNAGYTFEQGFLYAFIPDFDFDANIATMSEFKSYLGIT